MWINRVFGILVLIIGISLIGEGLYEALFSKLN